MDYIIEMEGQEKGLLFPMDIDLAVVVVRQSPGGFIGRMIEFNSSITPYIVRRILFKMAGFVFSIEWKEVTLSLHLHFPKEDKPIPLLWIF
jgi:hypothetical protein